MDLRRSLSFTPLLPVIIPVRHRKRRTYAGREKMYGTFEANFTIEFLKCKQKREGGS